MSNYDRYSDAPINREQWDKLEKTVIDTARRNLIGRRFIDIYGPLGHGLQSVVNDVFEEQDRGTISVFGENDNISKPSRREHLAIPLIHKDFILYWRDIEQAQALNIDVDFSQAANASNQLALLEDDLIFNGSKEFQLSGLMNVKGRQTHLRNDWMKSGNAFSDIVEARNKLLRSGHTGPYAVVLSPELYSLVHRVHEGTNVLEIEHIKELATDGVYQSPVIAEGTGVVISTGKQNLDLAVAEDFEVAYMDTENLNHLFRVYECAVLRIKYPSAICTLESM